MAATAAAPLLSLRNLKTRFYTYEGVVRALEGVDFDIHRGETFGLVGETGCGKSVTALSMMRLVPSPPGKIEEGEVLFLVPPDKWARIFALESEAVSAFKALREALRGASSLTAADENLLTAMEQVLSSSPPRLDVQILTKVAGGLRAEGLAVAHKAAVLRTARELIQLKSPYDLLTRPEDYMRKVRGNLIAMIFQEPMSALNPVIIVGDQIAENILLHQKEVLAKEVTRDLDKQIAVLPHPFAKRDIDPHTGLYRCTNCGKEADPDVEECTSCKARFIGPSRKTPLTGFVLRIYRSFYARMARNPNDLVLTIASRVPVLRRYERVMYRVAFERGVEMLNQVRIPDPEKVANSYPFELSGGMAQRAMIAIALSCSPRLLIADEPTTAVDVTIQAQVLRLMRDLKERVEASILLITHNLGVVAETCSRVGVMYAGIMAEVGPVRGVFKEPLHPYTRGLMESIPRATEEKDRLLVLRGNVPNLITPPHGCRFHPRCPVALAHCGWSATEVRERLEPRIRKVLDAGAAPAARIRGWDDTDAGKLVVRCDGDVNAIRGLVEGLIAGHREEDMALGAVATVTVVEDTVVLALLPQVKPSMLEVHAGHSVACYQYGGWPPA